MLVDETNLKIVSLANQLRMINEGTLPLTLSQLQPHDLERAYAMWRAGQPEVPRLWARIRGWWGVAIAEASTGVLYPSSYVSDIRIITCPSDLTPPPGGVSYVLNPEFAGMSRAAFEAALSDQINAGKPLIYEADDPRAAPSAKVYRHGGTLLGAVFSPATNGNITVLTTVDGEVQRQKLGASASAAAMSQSRAGSPQGRGATTHR